MYIIEERTNLRESFNNIVREKRLNRKEGFCFLVAPKERFDFTGKSSRSKGDGVS